MKKIIRSLSTESLLLLFFAVPYNFLAYLGGRQLARQRYHHCLSTVFDDAVPLLPWTMIIYWGCYVFWIINYYLGTKSDPSGSNRFIKTHYIGETIAFLFFVFFPTTMNRPDVIGNGPFLDILKIQYSLDSADNLLPSIHCFASWLCWIGVRGNHRIPKWYRHLSLLLAVSICISTLTVKQHVIADIMASIFLAEVSFIIAGLPKGGMEYEFTNNTDSRG